MTIDEIFATLPDEVAQDAHEYLVIDAATRSITVPEAERILGVEADGDAERKYFICPRYVGDGLDLASMFLTVNYRNANGYEDGYLVDDVTVNGDYVTFSWLIWPNVTAYKGTVQFAVCADLPNSSTRRGPDWNTTLAQGEVLVGLDPDRGDLEEDASDVLTQLRDEVVGQTAAVEVTGIEQVKAVKAAGTAATAEAQEQIEAKGAATLATIPADYTTMAGKVNEQANAIKGKLSGAVVRADDVSPVEHYPAIWVHSKNLLPYPYHQTTATTNGGTFTAQADGGVLCEGTPTDYASLNLYAGAPLAKAGNLVFSASGDYENANISIVIYDNDSNVLFNKETWKGGPIISAKLEDYPTATRWLVFIKRGTPNVEMAGTLYPQLELGPAATAYTPYVDPSTVTLRRCGKAVFAKSSQIVGKTEDGAWTSLLVAAVQVPPGNYVASCKYKQTGKDKSRVTISVRDFDDYTITLAQKEASLESGDFVAPFTVEGGKHGFQIFLYSNQTANELTTECLFENIQVEVGSVATAYEPYAGADFIPLADGTVPSATTLAPSMTIFTDTENVTVECEYNRDSNAVYAELLAKIAALSGTT